MFTAAILALYFLLPLINSVPYDTNLYSQGSNLVNNSMFSTPTLSTSYQLYRFNNLGWMCNNDICQLCHIPIRCA